MTETTHGGRRDGAGPKMKHGERTIQTAVRLPESLLAWIDDEAERRTMSRADVVVDALRRLHRHQKT
jgi:hypothetical protein